MATAIPIIPRFSHLAKRPVRLLWLLIIGPNATAPDLRATHYSLLPRVLRPHFKSAAELAALLETGQVSSVELTQAFIDRRRAVG